MAESIVESSDLQRLKFYDEDDELEIFAVELMYNLMKHFNDTNHVLLPKLPRPSKHYSPTVLKSVLIGWHITHENLSRRFRKAFPFMVKSRHHLFSYATCQAVQLFDRMLWFAQLIFLAAYCYELASFLSKNGLGEYLYVSYTLFCTLWKDQYEYDFACIKGWDHIEEALDHYAMLYDPLEDIFLPGYRFDYDDLQAVLMEYEIVVKREKDPGDVPVEEEIQNIFGSLDYRMRRRLVTVDDVQFSNLQYLMNFNTLSFVDVSNVSTPRKLIQYLMHLAIKENRYTGYSALLEEHELEDFEPCPASTDYDTDDSVVELLKNKSTDRCRSSLQSLSIHDTTENIRSEDASNIQSKDISCEKKKKKKKRKKSKAKASIEAKPQPKDGSEDSPTVGGTTSEEVTKLEPKERYEGSAIVSETSEEVTKLEPKERSEGSATVSGATSEEVTKLEPKEGSEGSATISGATSEEVTKLEPKEGSEGSATVSGATSEEVTKLEPDGEADNLKQSETSKSSNETCVDDGQTSSKSESPSKRRKRSRKPKSEKT